MKKQKLKVTMFAGGVGGAKMAQSLSFLRNISLSIIGNVADDDFFHGLYVSPDIDTLIYTLSDNIDKSKGWGVKKDRFNALKILSKLGKETWMNLGDSDLGLHIFRTELLNKGYSLSKITNIIAESYNISP